MVDWEALRTEYLEENTSYCRLAEKYGLSRWAVARRGREENWPALRKARQPEVPPETMPPEVTPETMPPENGAGRVRRLLDVTDKLMDRVEEILDEPERKPGTELKNLAGTLKTIKEIQMIRSELDEREQLAKVAAMEKQVSCQERLLIQLEDTLAAWSK